MNRAFGETAHRPWAMPRGPWVMAQVWQDLLFAHWPMEAETLRRMIPTALQLDMFEGRVWVGLVPFRMSGVRLRGAPAMPGLSAFPELNVRTYVVADGKPGVWFFSLDAANAIAVEVARDWFRLPYFHARMELREHDGWIDYRSERTDSRGGCGRLEMRYRPRGETFTARPETLDHFLTERYCLYSEKAGRVYRSEIQHPPWPLQTAEAIIVENTMLPADGLPQPDGLPLLHFSRRQDVVVWPLRRLSG